MEDESDFSFDEIVATLTPPEDVFDSEKKSKNQEKAKELSEDSSKKIKDIEKNIENESENLLETDVAKIEDLAQTKNETLEDTRNTSENSKNVAEIEISEKMIEGSTNEEKNKISDDSKNLEEEDFIENDFDFGQIAEELEEKQDDVLLGELGFTSEEESKIVFEDKNIEEEIGEEFLSEDEIFLLKEKIISVMEKENLILDEILEVQARLHEIVREKDWDKLNKNLEDLQNLSDDFTTFEMERESLCEKIDIRKDSDFSGVLQSVRGKLQKSKVENRVLNEYISTTRRFLQGVFDSVVPQRRNTLYSRTGKIIKNEPLAVAVDIDI